MLFNAIVMLVLNALLSFAAVGLIGFEGDGLLAAVAQGGSPALRAVLYMLTAWLAGILCFLLGSRLKTLDRVSKTRLSVSIWTILGFSVGLLIPKLGTALALPYAPILFVFTGKMLWPAFAFLSFLTPILALSAMQIVHGEKGRKTGAFAVMIGYIVVLMLLPIVAVVKNAL